jgi:hypothetical protein
MGIATSSVRQNVSLVRDRWPTTIWHRSAPWAVQRAYSSGNESAGWKAWQRHLRTRERPVVPAQLFGGGDRVLTWGLAAAEIAELFLPQFVRTDGPRASAVLQRWLADTAGNQWKLSDALSALAWCRGLPKLAAVLPADAWWDLLAHLLRTVAEADAAGAAGEHSGDGPLIHQLLAGELALTLAYLFPELTVCRERLPQARQALSAGLADLLDDRGLPHARHLDRLRPLLACWTRCHVLGRRLKHGCWHRDADRPYRRFVRSALRLARRDGSHVFSESATDHSGAELLAAAAARGGRPEDRRLAALLLPGGKKQGGREADLPAAAVHSEWAATAVLRPDWSLSAPRLTVVYPDTSCRMELSCGKDVLWSGPWALDVHLDGAPAVPSSPWSQLCWVSDDDVDYLELELALGDGLRVQRHVLLARHDRFLLLADAVLAGRPATIQYRGVLPLCSETTWREACETREGTLTGRKPRSMVLPLALPEWLADRRGGELVSTSAGLELRQTATGQALLAPLFFDLDRSRMSKPLTWRQLAVAESHQVQPADVAVGYRVAIGKAQWLIYRSLAPPQSRSLLGHNVRSETLVARFDRQGEVDSLIEIE